MRSTLFAAFFLAAAVLFAAGAVHSQPLPQQPRRHVGQQPPMQMPQQPPAPSGEAMQPGQEEPSGPVTSITIEDGRMSVELVDAEIGTVINDIARKLNCQAEVNRLAYGRKITTKFSGLDIQRAIERLLTLAQATNYMINYNAEGNVSKIQLYAPPSSEPGRASAPYRPLPGERYRRYIPPGARRRMVAPERRNAERQSSGMPAPRVIGQ